MRVTRVEFVPKACEPVSNESYKRAFALSSKHSIRNKASTNSFLSNNGRPTSSISFRLCVLRWIRLFYQGTAYIFKMRVLYAANRNKSRKQYLCGSMFRHRAQSRLVVWARSLQNERISFCRIESPSSLAHICKVGECSTRHTSPGTVFWVRGWKVFSLFRVIYYPDTDECVIKLSLPRPYCFRTSECWCRMTFSPRYKRLTYYLFCSELVNQTFLHS